MQSSTLKRQNESGTGLHTLWLASLGGALEFYDFVIFVFFTSVLAKLFFSAGTAEWLRQVETFGIFSVGYLARPLGGVVLAHYGDTLGRKRVFTLSILLMAVPTLLIGLIPTYRSIGIAAPLLLVGMRILQGIAIGGEAPGAWVFVAEHARKRQTGFAIGLLTAGLSLGIFLGSLVATGMNVAFSPLQIAAGFWRIPFLIGGVFGFGALFLRRHLNETPVFEEIRAKASAARELPLRMVLRKHLFGIAVSVVSTWTLTASIVVVILMTPTLLERLFHLDPFATQLANLAGTASLALSTVLVGAATDRFGVRRVAVPILLLLIVGAFGLYEGVGRAPSLLLPLYILAGLGTGAVVLTPIVMVRAFPPLVRFTGVSFSYNLAYAVFGGLTPPFVAWLVHLNHRGPADYVAIAAIAGMIVTLVAHAEESAKVEKHLSASVPDVTKLKENPFDNLCSGI
jgi:MFS family permease